MSFTVTILGSGSAVPSSGRGLTSQFVLCRGRNILIDCGEGTQLQIRRFGVKFQRIDYILISHLHGDHYFGLVGLLSTMHLMGRKKAIQIYAPEGLQEIVELQLHYGGARLGYPLVFHTTHARTPDLLFEDEKITIESFPLTHRVPTTGFLIREKPKERSLDVEAVQRDGIPIAYYHRLKKGEEIETEDGDRIDFRKYTHSSPPVRSYAFCSDTAFRPEIAEFVKGVSLLYHEATFTQQHIERARATMHSTAGEAAELAKQAGVERLLLGHISARYDTFEEHEAEATAIFPAVEMVVDGTTYTID